MEARKWSLFVCACWGNTGKRSRPSAKPASFGVPSQREGEVSLLAAGPPELPLHAP